jgi:hypothetical protein
LKTLKGDERELICLRYVVELSFVEIWAVLGRKQDTVRKSLNRILERYKARWRCRMSNPLLSLEFEEMMKNISNVPEPDAAFMSTLRTHFISSGVTSATDRTRTGTMRKQISPSLRWAIVIALIVALALLVTSPKAVAALKKLLGYVPEFGMVEQTASLRILAEPVELHRDSVTLTVEQVVADSEKTIVVYYHNTTRAILTVALNIALARSSLRSLTVSTCSRGTTKTL